MPPDGYREYDPARAAGSGWNDPDWTILRDRRGDLPVFPLAALPAFWGGWTERAARGAGAPSDYVATALLATVAGIVGCARGVEAGPSWTEPVVLWGAVVGDPSSGKSPALDAVRRTLATVESERRIADEPRQRDHANRVEDSKAAAERWRSERRDAAQRNEPPPLMPAAAIDPAPFVSTQIAIMDATIESIVDVVGGNPAGVLCFRDELAGWLGNMSRYNNGTDRPFWLQAWSAHAATVNRKGRAAVRLERLAVSILGSIQPDRLARSLAGDDDGLAARFLYSWPARPSYQPLSDDIPSVDPEAVRAFTRIASLARDGDASTFRTIPLAPDARRSFEAFRQRHHAAAGALDGLSAGWWGKGQGTVLRIAGLLALLEWGVTGREDQAGPRRVLAKHVEAACEIWECHYWAHARAALHVAGVSERQRNQRRVLRFLAERRQRIVTAETVRVAALGRRLDASETRSLLEGLCAAGWTRPIQTDGQRGRGRPTDAWEVNPALWTERTE